ncbi:hypothetical protein [Thaumasiovibrio subtropicus]|uniref:hypothetical protein n=1 Tax=Thaumasiovibrio subtropicus TaxID=1891207 RepID=UPI00131B2CA4|nr:hypothetical protein [Thaumasiovibrio subtropicus]
MSWNDFVRTNIEKHLLENGLPRASASYYARVGEKYYYENGSNLDKNDAFRSALDFAGKTAETRIKSFKYQPPKRMSPRSIKARPQEAFDFGASR